MKIGELFVNLKINGDNSANKALKNVDKGLKDIKTTSLEAKAAIVAVVFGLERMMSWSAKMGTSMLTFADNTGISTRALQQLQFAGRKAAIENDDIEQSLRGVQEAMFKMTTGQGAPSGMADLAQKIGFDYDRAQDTLYVWQKIQEYTQKTGADPLHRGYARSFGVSEAVVSGMSRNAFDPNIMEKAPVTSDKSFGRLREINAKWLELNQNLQMFVLKLNSAHGLQIINDLEKLARSATKLADALLKVVEVFHVFEGLDKATTAISERVEAIAKIPEAFSSWDKFKDFLPKLVELMNPTSMVTGPLFDNLGDRLKSLDTSKPGQENKVLPFTGRFAQPSSNSTTVNNNVTAHISGVKDGKDAAHHLKRQLDKAGHTQGTRGVQN